MAVKATMNRNSMVTDIITLAVAAAVGDYANLSTMDAGNIIYATEAPENVKAMFAKNNKLIMLGVGEGSAPSITIASSTQEVDQIIWALVNVIGARKDLDDKAAVQLAEELEALLWNNNVLTTTEAWIVGTSRFIPYEYIEGSNVIKSIYVEFAYKKIGTLGA